MQMQLAHTVLACINVLQLVAALDNGLARTPPMGWMVRPPHRLGCSCLKLRRTGTGSG